jgi:hypothetical protein
VEQNTTVTDDNSGTNGNSDTNTTASQTETNTTTDTDSHAGMGGGSDANGTTDSQTDANTTSQPIVALSSLTLTIDKTTLNKNETATVQVVAAYDDNSTKDVTDKIEWIIDNADTVKITAHTLKALQDKPVRLRTRLNGKLSNEIALSIYWEVNGHRLPPEPDPALNNATLGGVDSNHNGVRDDVERKIYEKYPVKLQRELMMDQARVFQKTMIKSVDEAKEIAKEDTNVIDCGLYLGNIDKDIESDKWIEKGKELKNIIFNNKKRVRKYLDYNLALSGGVYGSSPSDWNQNACSAEIREILKEMGK